MKIFLRSLLLVIILVLSNAGMAQKLYWVGGSGNFNDPAHWSYNSNGTGGAKTPGTSDDVYFDENSFKSASVINIVGGANCRNLIFSDNTAPVILNGTQNEKLTISGDVALNPYVDNQFSGEIHLTSSQNNTAVSFSIAKIKGNLFFEGASTWNLTTLLGTNNSAVYFNGGKVNLDHSSVYAGSILVKNNVSIICSQSALNAKNKLWFNSGAVLVNQGVYIEAPINNPTKFNLGGNQVSSNRMVNNDNSTLACAFTSTVISSPQCANSCDGVVAFTIPSCGVAPYTATWNSLTCAVPVGTPATVTPGTYTQTNVCGCGSAYQIFFADAGGNFIGSANVSITGPSAISVFTNTVQPLCAGACNGKIKAIVIGGTQPYSIQWSPGPTHTNNFGSDSITGLCVPPASYVISITDNHSCTYSTTVNLAQPAVITTNGGVRAPLCSGVCNGMAWVVPSGGSPFAAVQSNGIKYTTVWDGNAALNNDTLYNLCAASTHTCVVTDKNGCTATYTVVVPAAPLPITFTQTNNSPLNCQNICNGALSVTASGGTPAYTFSWVPVGGTLGGAAPSSSYNGLCAGHYTCTVKDANGCTVQATYTITSPAAISHTLTATNPKCNGQTSGILKDSVSGGTPPYTSFAWSVPLGTITTTSTSSTDANLGPGTYSVVLTDSKGCKDTARATLINPPAITATLTPVNPLCFGSTNGQICVTASGGTGSVYTYSWTPAEPATACITGLGAGSFTVAVADSNNCKKIVSTTLTAPLAITFAITKTNPSCFSLCNGTAVVGAPSGGSGSGYTYSWSCAPGNTTNSLGGQCGGTTCTVTVKDGNGCSQSKVINFTNPNPLSITASATPLVCANQCNSQITTNVTGGTPTYTYTWSGSGVTAGSPGQTNMCAGSYSVIVTDSNNCTASANVTVSAPNPLIISATFVSPTCSGGCDGSINASITGGAIPYAYTWNPFIGPPPTLTPNSLCSGSYALSVIDANGCTATQTVTLTNPTAVTASVTSTNVNCAGQCDGTAAVTANGGTAPYFYSWDGAPYTASTSTLNLCAGTHTVQVKDSKGCTAASLIYSITQPPALTASVSNITKSCLNICNGTASASASGGSGGYTYSWDASGGPFSGVTNINTLCIGTHTLYVKDANGCIASTVFNVQVIINVNILANSISVSCHNVCDGSASATASGGSGPYTFSWTPSPSPTPSCTNVNACTANNLCPGTYTVLVTDQTGCASEDTITILNPPVLTTTVTTSNATCFGICNGSATILVGGGTAPYTEQWSNNGIIGPNPTGLCPGTYTATVVDNRGCTVSNPIIINSSPQFTVAPTVSSPTACLTSTGGISLAISGGSGTYTVNWSNPPGGTGTVKTGLAAGIYTATITDANGCDTVIAIGVSDPTGPTTSVVINQNASCYGSCNGSATVSGIGVNPINVTWTTGSPSGISPVTDNALCAGSYPVKVTDGNGCISIENVTITEPTQIIANAVITPLTCSSGNTGGIVLSPSGGAGPAYTYTLNGNPTSNPITGLSAGIQTVVIADVTHCSQTYTYNIATPTSIVITVTKTDELCAGTCNGTAQAGVTGGTPAYTYLWTNSTGTISVNPNVAGMCPGTYTLTVTDTHTCTAQAIVVINPANPILPNLVTQNNNCNTGCTGTASVSPTGGSGSTYTYNWNTPGTPTGTSVSGICPGSYFVTITDVNLCAITKTFTITAPPTVTASVVYTSPTCFGYSNGSATVTPTGGTPTYTVTWSPPVGCIGCVSTSSIVAGSYVATVTDSKGCNGSVSFTVKDSAKLNSNTTATGPLCNNSCNGSITSSPIGGNGGYTYQWLGITPSPGNSPTANNLCAAGNPTYTLIVTDSKNCRDTAHVILTNPPPITLNVSTQAATCAQNNGVVTINTVTPSGTLSVNWLAPSTCTTSPTCSNLAAGIYSVTLTNSNNCKDTFQIGVTNSNGPIVALTSTNITCFGTCNGTASVTATGGTPGTTGYTYNWNTIPVSIATSVSGLCGSPPSYISTVTDSLLCKTLTTFTISSPPQITDNPNIINATCAGINNGSITSHGSGGTPSVTGYLYSIGGGAFTNNNAFTNLAIGSYVIQIKDSLGCINTFTYTINGSTIILPNLTSTNNTCYGVCAGTANLSITGGAAPYIITWNDPSGQAGPLAVNLCVGSYTATITDTMGCKVTQPVTITAPTTSVSPNATITNPSCGLCNGTINLAPSGGNGGAYTYTWNTASSSANISNVCAGLYQVDVSDVAGCKTTFQIPVSNSNAPAATITSTNPPCFGTCNGTASVTASGGTAPYTYNWVSSAATTPSISGLCAGTYYVQVKDAANCVQTESVTITSPTQILLHQTVTPTDCGKCNGAVTVAPTGGSGVYTYTWNGAPSSASQTNLCAGSYTLEVNDGTCTDTSFININSTNAPIVTVNVTNPTCFGMNNGTATAVIIGGVPVITTHWSNGATTNPDAGLGGGIYNLVVTDNNGCAAVQNFTVTAPTQVALSLNNTQLPSCSNVCNGLLTAIPSGGTLPYTYTWSPVASNQDTIGHLCAGSYTVNVTDANGCAISQVSALVNNPFLISANPTVVKPSCAQCNGSITLAPSGGNTPYTYTWTTSPINNTNQQTNVCPGIYQVDIKDLIGCTQTVSIPVSSSNSPTVTVATTNITCFGLSNGSATATATGGILPYTYNWPTVPSTNSAVNGLGVNTYYVQVKDSAGCIATQSVSITAPAQLNANATMTAPTSCTVCNGSISTAVTGGSGSYTYSWSANAGSVTTPTVGNLCAGVYTLVVTDAVTGCQDTLPPMGLNNLTGPIITVAVSNQTCFGTCNGSATVTATGGITPYTYTWTPTGGNATIVNGLCATQSPFMVEVADHNGCIQTQSVTVTTPTQLIASLPTITPPKCLNNMNGAIATVVSGGTPAYTYSWSPATLTGSNPQNLGAGAYTYTVTDANGCSISQTATLVDNLLVINPHAAITQPTCAQCNGTILLAPSGGTTPYTYTWTTSPISNVNPQTNVCAGIYQVAITDAIGCQQTVQIPVSSSNSPTLTVTSTSVSCNGLSNGSATATATGGILPYIYSWPAIPSNNPVQAGLGANTYYVQVKDSAGCIATQSVSIAEPTALNPNATMVSPTSCSVCNGSISTAVTGGSGSYNYLWSPGSASTATVTGLCAGIYTLVLTDNGSGCKDTLTMGLNSPTGPSLTISSSGEKCFGDCSGTATVTATGGTTPYTYTWTPNGGSGNIATGLCANQSPFMVEVADHNGCIQTQSVTISQPTKLITGLPTITPVKCFNNANGAINTVVSGGTPGYTYVWNPATATGSNPQNLAPGIYSLTVTDANNCINNTEVDTLTNPTPMHVSGVTTPAACNNTPNGSITETTFGGTPGYTWLWNNGAVTQNLPAILPGTYSLTATDSHGCIKDTTFTVISTITVTVNAGKDTSICNSASIVLTGTVTGSTTFDWYTSGVAIPPVNTLTLSINPSSTTSYVLIATNSGCTNSDTVVVSISSPAAANAGPDQSILSGQGINIGGNPTNPGGGSVVWMPNIALTDTSATNPVASPTLTTTYIVVVTNSFGCKARDTMVVTVLPPFDIPNGFTPNGDSKNDTWMLDNLYKFPNAEVEVYNRWGEQLFYSRGNYTPWNGNYNGSPVPVGTYYYIIKLNDKNYPDHYAGPLTILR